MHFRFSVCSQLVYLFPRAPSLALLTMHINKVSNLLRLAHFLM